MKLTGKAKEDFEKWYTMQNYELDLTTDLSPHTPVIGFDELDDPMKYGVFVDFFDSVNIRVDILSAWEETKTGVPILTYRSYLRGEVYGVWGNRTQSRTAAVEEANEIYNTRHE